MTIMYELLQGNATKYFVSIHNENTVSSFFIGQDGSAALQIEKPRKHMPVVPKDAIAKKN